MELCVHPSQAPVLDATTTCTFLDVVPLEIREMIYRYVLVVKTEHNMNSLEYSENRDKILRGADHIYKFYTSIYLANHQINHEASELFQRENLFMSLKLSAESHSHRIGRHIKDEGLPIIAEGDRARKFPNIVMTLALESSYKVDAHSLARWLPENRVPGVFVFACDDLPAVYKGFTHWSGSSRCYSERLDIAVDPRIGYAHSEARDGSPCCQPRLARLLEPLHHIHGIRIGSIFGLGSASLEEKIIDSMGAPLEESGAIAKRIARAFDQGDLARSSGDLRLAVVKYKDGLDLLDSPYREYDEDEIWENGPDSGQPICCTNAETRFQARLASCYIDLGKMRMARIYTDRARGRRGSGGREYESSATALKRMTNGRTLYAEVMALAARINYIHHSVWEACVNLWEAVDLDPHNLENRRLLAEFEERHNILGQRQDVKREAWKRENLRQGERVEATIQIAIGRKSKADEAFRSGQFLKAISKYRSALSKIETVRDMPLKENVLWNREERFFPEAAPIDSFCLVLRSRIVSSCLGMAAYEDVCSWVNSTLAIKPELRHLTDMKEWPIFVRPHYRTVHFCKALALERMGKLEEAIRCAELALKVEPGNETVFHWLKVFRKKWEPERVRREKQRKKDRALENKTRRNGRA